MSASKKRDDETRVQRHRRREADRGSRRVEVSVPQEDAALMRTLAGVLRSGGPEAERVRSALKPFVAPAAAKTGAELVAFFRNSPFVETGLDIERERSAGRAFDLG